MNEPFSRSTNEPNHRMNLIPVYLNEPKTYEPNPANDKILRQEGESLPYGPKAGGLKP